MSNTASTSANYEREFEYTDRDFENIRKLIYARVGISLAPVKRDMVYSRLARRLRALQLRSFKEYLGLLENDTDEPEWEAFTNALTTNLTAFFREAHHFDVLRQHLIKLKGRPQISVWCSASSTGEEPYSIAITAAQAWDALPPGIDIVATDVDTNVLNKAKAGVYGLDRLDKLPPALVKKFFLRGTNAQEGLARVRPELQRMIQFGQLNLLDARYWVKGPFDAIFCRNVLIYFDKPTQAAILRKMAALLKPDGLLFVGHSESLFHVSDILKLQGKTVYTHAQRKAA